MQIFRILNNNVVIGKTENGEEKIFAGKGIGFQKNIGDMIDMSNVNKIFHSDDSFIGNRLKMLLSEIPIEIISLTQKIVDEISLEGIKVSDSIFLSVSDHIKTAIEQCQNQTSVPNTLLIDIKNFYPLEYNLGVKVLKLIKEEMNIDLPIDEAGYIAMHIVNAQSNTGNANDVYASTKLIQDIVSIVKLHFSMEIVNESVYYYRFITHLKYFCKRVVEGQALLKTDLDIDNLYQTAVNRFRDSFQCVMKIKEFLEYSQNYKISNEEVFYLTIHIERVVKNIKNS